MELEVERENYNFREKGILEKYNALKEKIGILVFFFDTICDFIEKVAKLLNWHDQKSSYIFLTILLLLFVAVTFLPIRFLIVLASIHISS